MSPNDDGVDEHIFLTSYVYKIPSEYLDVNENKIRTYNSYINRYPFFINLYKTLHRKRMNASQHCGVLVKPITFLKCKS
jgi:hypothetical protein